MEFQNVLQVFSMKRRNFEYLFEEKTEFMKFHQPTHIWVLDISHAWISSEMKMSSLLHTKTTPLKWEQKKYKIKINQWCQKLKNLLLLYVHTQQKILEKKKGGNSSGFISIKTDFSCQQGERNWKKGKRSHHKTLIVW